MTHLLIKKIDAGLPTPQYMTPGSVGADLYIARDATIGPKEWALIPLGLVVKVPAGTMVAIVPRSSTFRKTGLICPNSFGVIDQDYCGDSDQIHASVYNTTDQPVTVRRGDRLFQMLVIRIEVPEIIETTGSLAEASRGGFGSTDGRG